MTNKKIPKNPQNYSCDKCFYFTSNKKDFNKHLITRKHKILTNTNEKSQKIPKSNDMYECVCGKKYKHSSSLSKHKKSCKHDTDILNEQIKTEKKEENIDYKEMFVQLVDQNNELQKTIHKMIPKLGNTTYSQNNTQHFNINVFLNETCKDALNIM
jgi:undecaprenyl pyrophosphate synthase